MARAVQQNFTKGEIAPEMEARFDLSAYQVGLRRARNCMVVKTGGIRKRMGTRYIADAISNPSRLIPFQFSNEQGYALEFGQATMRPLAFGGAILEPANGLSVVSITNANPAVAVVTNNGFTVGRQVYFVDIEGMTEINGRFITIIGKPDANTLILDIDTTNFGVFTGSAGGDVNVTPPVPPTPPVVPPVLPPPPDPPVGSGGGGGFDDGGSFHDDSGKNQN
jgi:hypothetical protein